MYKTTIQVLCNILQQEDRIGITKLATATRSTIPILKPRLEYLMNLGYVELSGAFYSVTQKGKERLQVLQELYNFK